MVAYAVGEMSRHVPTAQEDSGEDRMSEENQRPSSSSSITRSSSRRPSSTAVRHRRQRPLASCYEVVTAWVHPR
jgi:hypothetical protein